MRDDTYDLSTLFMGGVIGFLTGCCGLLASVFLFRKYTPGIILGIGARIVFGVCVGMLVEIDDGQAGSRPVPSLDQLPSLATEGGLAIPWEIVGGVAFLTVALTVVIGCGLWAFGAFDSDAEEEAPSTPPDRPYVTFDR